MKKNFHESIHSFVLVQTILLSLVFMSFSGIVSEAAVQIPDTKAALSFSAQSTISAALGRDNKSYHTSRIEKGYKIENKRHGFFAELTAGGMRVSVSKIRWGLT